MRFDAADLALIETSLDVVEEPARGIIEEILAMVRELQEGNEDLEAEVYDLKETVEELKNERDDLDREVLRLEGELVDRAQDNAFESS